MKTDSSPRMIKNKEYFENIINNVTDNGKKTIKEITDLEKFEKIDKNDKLYRLFYTYLSQEAHCDIRTLENQFYEIKNDKFTYKLDIKKSLLSKQQMVVQINILICQAIISIGKIHNFNTVQFSKALDEVYSDFIKTIQ